MDEDLEETDLGIVNGYHHLTVDELIAFNERNGVIIDFNGNNWNVHGDQEWYESALLDIPALERASWTDTSTSGTTNASDQHDAVDPHSDVAASVVHVTTDQEFGDLYALTYNNSVPASWSNRLLIDECHAPTAVTTGLGVPESEVAVMDNSQSVQETVNAQRVIDTRHSSANAHRSHTEPTNRVQRNLTKITKLAQRLKEVPIKAGKRNTKSRKIPRQTLFTRIGVDDEDLIERGMMANSGQNVHVGIVAPSMHSTPAPHSNIPDLLSLDMGYVVQGAVGNAYTIATALQTCENYRYQIQNHDHNDLESHHQKLIACRSIGQVKATVHEHDIVFGKGASIRDMLGNVAFRRFVDQHYPEFINAKMNKHKNAIKQKINDKLIALGYHFYTIEKRNNTSDNINAETFVVQQCDEVMTKIGKRLRDSPKSCKLVLD